MRILWLTWKDIEHPQAGGAEVVSSELGKRLVRDGHEVIFVTADHGSETEAEIDGYKVIRVGSRYSVYWKAFQYVKRNLADWPDVVIEEINTIPFFSRFYWKGERRLFFHMLCRKIWFYQLPLPLSAVGYAMEPLYLRMLNSGPTIAMSHSTKNDLVRYGFNPKQVDVISEGIQLQPVKKLNAKHKFSKPTMVSLGNIRPMKRTLHQLKAFEQAKANIKDLQLKVAGDSNSRYGRKVLDAIKNSPFATDIEYLGRVNDATKQTLLQRAHVIAVTSVKEGWGLIVTEAASQGTPAVVYNVDGLRDSVIHRQTGYICTKNTPAYLAENIINLFSNSERYAKIQQQAWEWSKLINFDTSYKQFKEAAGI